MQNLREKLLKAGLISENQPDAKTDAARGRNRSTEERTPREQSAPRRHAPIPKLPPLAVPNNKELQRVEARKQLEQDRRIRELVASSEVAQQRGEQTFYFVTRKNRLRRMELTPDLARKLEAGELAVVERPEPDRIEHSIVPASTADRILELSSRAVRFYNRKDSPVGFLSDEELARRQRAEADGASAPEEASTVPPEDATGFGYPVSASDTQHLAAAAEREAARSATAEE
jgi:uncharacterized protein YaiL (DUF2058 family)